MKTVVITGATGGIGEELLTQSVDSGYEVIGTYSKNEEKAKNISEKYGVTMYQLDFLVKESIEELAKVIQNKNKSIDVLINNAGSMVRSKRLEEQTHLEITEQIGINLIGTILLTRSLLPLIKETIINIGSKLIQKPIVGSAPYIASKAGLEAFTKTLALEYPTIISVLASPRLTATTMGNYKGDDPKKVAKIIHQIITRNIIVKNGDSLLIDEYLNLSG